MNKKLRNFIIFSSLLAISIGTYYTYINFYKPWYDAKHASLEADSNKILDDELYIEPDNVKDLQLATEAVNSETSSSTTAAIVKAKQLPVEYISQLPELPTGCEITSLAEVLNYLGYQVDKEYLAENDLKMLDDLDGSFNNYFIGSPWDENGWGCFAPAITNAANKYLTSIKSSKKAYNISGSSLSQLFTEIQNGNPVIVWVTTRLDERTVFDNIEMNNGTTFKWPENEHCVVLVGYDLNSPQTVTVADPLAGVVERTYSQFNSRYNELGKRAVVIK